MDNRFGFIWQRQELLLEHEGSLGETGERWQGKSFSVQF
jgi:hypothetical protein